MCLTADALNGNVLQLEKIKLISFKFLLLFFFSFVFFLSGLGGRGGFGNRQKLFMDCSSQKKVIRFLSLDPLGAFCVREKHFQLKFEFQHIFHTKM